MSKYSGTQFTLFLVDGYNLIAAFSETASLEKEAITQQSNEFGAGNETHTPLNIEKGVITVGGGFFDATTNALLGVFNAVRGLKRIIALGYEGNTVGKGFTGYEGVYDSKYSLMDTKDALTKANLLLIVSGNINEGVIVQNLATFTATWDTKTGGANAPDTPVDFTLDPRQRVMAIASNTLANPTVVTMATQHGSPIAHGLTTGDVILISDSNSTPTINGSRTVTVISPTTFSVPVNVTVAGTAGSFVKASSNAGGVGYLEVTAYTGSTGFIDKIMHSPDDTTYAALITFTDLGSTHTPAKERKTVAGNIDRYLSNQGNLTGAGSITVFAGFARN